MRPTFPAAQGRIELLLFSEVFSPPLRGGRLEGGFAEEGG
jgi:hypothetical protein